MSRHTATLFVLAAVTAISARDLLAQPAPLPAVPSAPETAPAPEPPPAPPAGIFPSAEVGLTNRVSLRAFGVLPLEGFSDGGVAWAF